MIQSSYKVILRSTKIISFTKHIDRYKDNEMLYLEKKNVSVVTRTKDDHGGNAQTGGRVIMSGGSHVVFLSKT